MAMYIEPRQQMLMKLKTILFCQTSERILMNGFINYKVKQLNK